MKTLSTIISVFILTISFSQSSYFGSKNSFEITYSVFPKIEAVSAVDLTKNEATTTRNFSNSYLTFNVARIVSKKIELSAGFSRKNLSLATSGAQHMTTKQFYTTTVLDEYEANDIVSTVDYISSPKVIVNMFNFNLKYFRLGSMAPVGKFIGVGIKFGGSRLSKGTLVDVGLRDEIKTHGKITSTYNILKHSEIDANESKYNFFQVNFQLGRNFPITNNILFCTQVTAPLFKPYTIDGRREYVYRDIVDVLLLRYKNHSIRTRDHDFSRRLENTMNKFTDFTINVGIKVHF
jgi:hypothetical protein